jgi:hypothetical protein
MAANGHGRSASVARRLMIDLWRYLEAGVIPEGQC